MPLFGYLTATWLYLNQCRRAVALWDMAEKSLPGFSNALSVPRLLHTDVVMIINITVVGRLTGAFVLLDDVFILHTFKGRFFVVVFFLKPRAP